MAECGSQGDCGVTAGTRRSQEVLETTEESHLITEGEEEKNKDFFILLYFLHERTFLLSSLEVTVEEGIWRVLDILYWILNWTQQRNGCSLVPDLFALLPTLSLSSQTL